MATWIILLITVPLVGWLTAVVVGAPQRERRRLAELRSGAEARGWTYTDDASRLQPPVPRLREWQRRLHFREGFAGTYHGQEFCVAHVVHEGPAPAHHGRHSPQDAGPGQHPRRTHATICWIRLPFPLHEVRIVPIDQLEDRRRQVGGTVHRTGHAAFDERFAVLTDDELLGRMAVSPAVRTLLTATRLPWSVTLQGITLVAERPGRVPQTTEDALNGVAIAAAVTHALTGRSRP